MYANRQGLILFPVALVLASASGCTVRYEYSLSCVVKNAADGKPLSGVQAVFDEFGRESDLSYGTQLKQLTDAEGRMSASIFVGPFDFNPEGPRWYLKLVKEGFVPEIVDIKATSKPEKARDPIPMFVVVYLRPNG
jgi:hypothetical protein